MYKATSRTINQSITRQLQNRRVVNPSAFSRRLTTIERRATQLNKKATTPNFQIQQRVVARPTLSNFRSMATVTNDTTAYKQSPFVQWKLFPDFEKLLGECKPEQAIPVFQQLINETRDKFLAMEKQFEPTFNGTIGQCKV